MAIAEHRDLPLAWITGAGGLLGSWLTRLAPQCGQKWQARPLLRADLELSDHAAVRQLFLRERPTLVIHCAALSRSTDCQARPALARQLNVELTAHLAELAADVPFFFFSTDLVFDGRGGNYHEASPVNPLSVYAETKAAAERLVLANPRHTVIRTSLNAGPSPAGDRGFDEQLLCAWRAGQTLRLYTDEFRSPIPAEATVRAVWELATRATAGLYHVAGAQKLSRWEIGTLLSSRHPELNPKLQPASLKEYSGAPRSPDTSLNCAKVQSLLSFPLPRWSDWLTRETPQTRGEPAPR